MSIPDDAAAIADALMRLRIRRGPFGRGLRGHPDPASLFARRGGAGRGGGPDAGGRPFDHPGGRGRGEQVAEGEDPHEPFGSRSGGRAQVRLVLTLARAGQSLSVGELGEAIEVDQPRASRLVSQGVDLGLLRREADPDDARRTRIALTTRGQAIADRLRGAHSSEVETALAGFSAAERTQLASLLTRFANAWPR